MNVFGHGLGQWRADAQGELNERLGRCDLFIRHAHSDLLEYCYELGILPVAILFGYALWLMRKSLVLVLPFIPLFLFSFPSERPEVMGALAFSVAIFFREKSESPRRPALVAWVNGIAVMGVFAGISMWAYSQDMLGGIFRKTTDISKLNSMQQFVLTLYPQDLLNNSLSLYQAHYLILHGNVDSAKEILMQHLQATPNDLGVQKQLLQLDPSLKLGSVYCTQNSKP